MSGTPDQEKKTPTRDWYKCSECRRRKQKASMCLPQPRDWEGAKEKCQHCQKHGLFCGPNYRNNEDPAVIRSQAQEGSSNRSSQASAQCPRLSALQSPAAPLSTSESAVDTVETQRILPFIPGLAENRREPIGGLSDEALGEEASSRLSQFHALGTSLLSTSQTPLIRHAHGPSQPYDDLLVGQALHSLFIYIYKICVELDGRGQCDRVRWILFAIVSALYKYPGLVDGRKGHVLLRIALTFQRLGHRWESEHILVKLAGMYGVSALAPHDDPCYLLAGSFPDSSELIKTSLANLWQETVGGDPFDLNLRVPPLHRAVQERNPGIVMAILSDANGLNTHPPAIRQQSPEDTASRIGPSIPNIVAPSAASTEERDLRNRTALFLAVTNGDEGCCHALLCRNADVNTRDAHGHTALEMAARGGYLNIAKQLTDSNAHVNPDMGCCSSSPLQAAIESDNFNLDLVSHLLNLGAFVWLSRYDNKSAIDLADERGHTQLAANMRQKMISDTQHQYPFVVGETDFAGIPVEESSLYSSQ
ncbi:hypothetical protein BDR22DRAFT_893753 [Usnea florida]